MDFPALFFSPAGLQTTAEEILQYNRISARFGQALTPGQAHMLAEARQQTLQATHRVDFGTGLLQKFIAAFCDSPFIAPAYYADTLAALKDIFYHFKNQTQNRISDDELLAAMAGAFNGPCQGSLELLAGRELEKLARRLRCGGFADEAETEEEEERYEE
ncbi:MAG: DUF6323 family protein [Oscillospiraceae bacterium]